MSNRSKVTAQQGCVIFAKNKKRVSAFYQQTLGLQAVESEPSHDLLRGNGYEVVVHSIPRKYAASIKIAKPGESHYGYKLVEDSGTCHAVGHAVG